ncbi:uncharacterized protein B0H18DRAFT_1019101 [Fomitopsis serialis]|uniref:uncharacterized protein n=1 Tax=Fomitopsis serialis TaxID=139415 RepID=UPI0020083CE9|nr:uncharacterized protein B0H18DRAFT_1019101 [Neoantrodia serialis]KAH9922098.1 hypothetical protein B0H18DRAFT_1019101 [Neoantrodia serialis]
MQESACGPRLKRARADASEDGDTPRPTSEDIKRDQVVWFDDGNIMLLAGGVAFRVYRGLLALHSEIFADMFSVPQPESVEQLDGCPVIHLTDHPDELRHFLRDLFVDKKYNRHNETLPCTTVVALARLAHKYGIKDMLDDALCRVQSCFSDNLYIWIRADENMHTHLMTFDRKDAVAAVNIARLTETTSMLPVALYMCCQLEIQDIMNGVMQENGTVERLAPGDVMKCLEARKTLAYDNVVSAARIFTPVAHISCLSQESCTAHILGLFQRLVNHRAGLDICSSLGDWVPYILTSQSCKSLCGCCYEMVQGRAIGEQEEVWRRLPKVMGVEVHGWMS